MSYVISQAANRRSSHLLQKCLELSLLLHLKQLPILLEVLLLELSLNRLVMLHLQQVLLQHQILDELLRPGLVNAAADTATTADARLMPHSGAPGVVAGDAPGGPRVVQVVHGPAQELGRGTGSGRHCLKQGYRVV